jgi:hypothetical protein
MNNIFSQLLTGSTTTGSSNGAPSATQAPNANRLGGGLFNSNLVQDYMQQILQNPQQLESIMSTPHMQSMLQMVASNPEMSRLLVDSNPQLAANPELREQVTRSLPQMMQQVFYFLFKFFKINSYETNKFLVTKSRDEIIVNK